MLLRIGSYSSLLRHVIQRSGGCVPAGVLNPQNFPTFSFLRLTHSQAESVDTTKERTYASGNAEEGNFRDAHPALRNEQGRVTSSPSKTAHTDEFTYQRQAVSLSSLIPAPSKSNHTSQASFLAHSKRTGLNPTSTVFTGTRYEYLALSSLGRLGVELAKVGGTGDKGVDLVGYWHLPQWSRKRSDPTQAGQTEEQGTERIKVVVQCKRISPTTRAAKTVGPNVVRELEGAFRGAPSGWRGMTGGDTVLGILVSTRAATKGVIEGMKRSERPLAWVLLKEVEEVGVERQGLEGPKGAGDSSDEQEDADPETDDSSAQSEEYTMITGQIKQILWNQKAREVGLEGLDVVKRHSLAEEDTGDEVVLMWKGRPVKGVSADDD